jgi:hypothetical protein
MSLLHVQVHILLALCLHSDTFKCILFSTLPSLFLNNLSLQVHFLYMINRPTVTQHELMLQVVNGTSWWIMKNIMINWELLKTVSILWWTIQTCPVQSKWWVRWVETCISSVHLLLHSFRLVLSGMTVSLYTCYKIIILYICMKVTIYRHAVCLAKLLTPDVPCYLSA